MWSTLTFVALAGLGSAFNIGIPSMPIGGRNYMDVALETEFQLDFFVVPKGVARSWSKVVDITATRQNGGFGGYVPKVWFRGGTTKMHVCHACDGNANRCMDTNDLPMRTPSQVSVKVQGGKFSVSVGGKTVKAVVCNKPYQARPGQRARLMWYPTALVDLYKISYRPAGVTTLPPPEDDLNVRFNKMNMGQSMDMWDYPLDMPMAKKLRDTDSVSVIHQHDCLNCLEIADICNSLPGGPPTHPSSDPRSSFWQEMREVIQRQKDRRANVDPNVFMPLPAIWEGYDIHDVAEAVHDEVPGVHHSSLIAQLLSGGAAFDRSILPAQSKVDFLRGPVVLSKLNGWSISTVGPTNFGAKWMFGRARPEEVAWLVARKQLGTQHGVPADIVKDILYMKLSQAQKFTAYSEGSPVHPSWPAMHSAASSGSLWLATVMNLTPEEFCEAKKVDYAVAYGRTVAGVHYPTDNTAGLNMGQEIVARELPAYLAEQFGADAKLVAKKIASLRFDWRDFTNTPCFKSRTPRKIITSI